LNFPQAHPANSELITQIRIRPIGFFQLIETESPSATPPILNVIHYFLPHLIRRHHQLIILKRNLIFHWGSSPEIYD